MASFDKIKKTDNKYFMNTYSPYDIAFVKGKGCVLTDSEGKEYIDFLSGIAVNSLGYGNKVVLKAIKKQASQLMLVSNYFYTEQRGKLAEALVRGSHLNKVFFANSGAEANECAIKLARKYFKEKNVNRFKIVSAYNSFHGRTLATVTATGQPKYNLPFAPLPTGIGIYIPFNDIEAMKAALSDSQVAALMIECVQGEGGVTVATKEYMSAIKKVCKDNGILLIMDEVQTGCGRTGKFFGFEHYDVKPDIVTMAKGIGGGFPISACLATDEVAMAFKSGDHGTTFGANPLACAVSLAVVNTVGSSRFLSKVNEKGDYLKNKLKGLKESFGFITEIKGLGLMVGCSLDENKAKAKDIVVKMLEKGFVLNACGNNTLRFIPPLIISEDEIDKMILALKEVLKDFI